MNKHLILDNEELNQRPTLNICKSCFDKELHEDYFEETLNENEYLREDNTMIAVYECDIVEEETTDVCQICFPDA